MGMPSCSLIRVPPPGPPATRKHAGCTPVAVFVAMTRDEHNRKEAEREVSMLLRGEGPLYRYMPFKERRKNHV